MIEEILERFRDGQSLRYPLADGGELHLDGRMPFLLVHRRPRVGDDRGTDRLITGEASFLIWRSDAGGDVGRLIRRLAEAGSTAHGAFLVLEVWGSRQDGSRSFTVHAPAGPAPETVRRLAEGLERVAALRPGLNVVVRPGDERHPPDLPPLLSIDESWRSEVLVLGLEVPPVHRDRATGEVYPRFLRRLRRALSRAIRPAIHEFVRVQTTAQFESHLALGTRRLADSVREIDRELVALERTFDLLLMVSPVNPDEAWARFEADRFERNPELHYRLLPLDPDLLKRRLFAIEMETIEDPAFADLFQDKRNELDTILTMLGERGTPAFRHSCHRLYGTVDGPLLRLARDLLETVRKPGPWRGGWIDASGFRDAAAAELAYYRERHPELDREIQIRPDVVGLMVSEGNLLIGDRLRIRSDRLLPLLHHEVGTHVLTYVNGSAQPLEQLALGLADYDELQEGLAVLAEYLAGGLDALRMRLLAARVVAAHSVQEGADFVETFRMLRDEYGYTPSGAWHVTARVHASGGFTRDLIYLRGLVRLLELLRSGCELRPLYLGKIAQKHIAGIDELRQRGILREPPLTPRVLEDPEGCERLDAVRRGLTLTEMICSPSR